MSVVADLDLDECLDDWWSHPELVSAFGRYLAHDTGASGRQVYEYYTEPWLWTGRFLVWLYDWADGEI